MSVKAVVFDVDGTLYFKNSSIVKSYMTSFCKDYGINLSEAEVVFRNCFDEVKESSFGFDSVQSFWNEVHRKGLKILGEDEELYPVLQEYHDNVFKKEFIENISPVSGLIKFLKKLRNNGFKLIVLTGTSTVFNSIKRQLNDQDEDLNKHRVIKKNQLEKLGLTNFFDHVFLSREFGGYKPEKFVFEGVLKELNLNGDDCVMIGDSRHDIAAKSVGMKTVWINNKNKEFPKNYAYQPDLVIKNYKSKELYDFIF